MKKIIALSVLTGCLAATSSFAQGWLQLNSLRSQVWDGFTTAGADALSSKVDVAWFWAAGANVANPMPGQLANSSTTGNSTTTAATAGYTAPTAWSDILGSAFTLVTDANAGNAPVIVTTTTKGAATYIAGAGFAIPSTSAGGSITLVEVAWNSAFATPTAAQTGGSSIGWGYLGSLVLGTSATDPNIVNGAAAIPSFGVFTPVATPEPGTMALAALGGASLLLFRRKK
jgi:hypothetical protein